MDEDRPGLKARNVQHLARDLMLARDLDAQQPAVDEQQWDIGETHGRRGRAIFLVGAGCSASAGIPLAPKVAQTCVRILARRYSPPKKDPRSFDDPNKALGALISEGKVPARYLLSGGEGDWSALYTYLFAEHLKNPNHQRESYRRRHRRAGIQPQLGARVSRRDGGAPLCAYGTHDKLRSTGAAGYHQHRHHAGRGGRSRIAHPHFTEPDPPTDRASPRVDAYLRSAQQSFRVERDG